MEISRRKQGYPSAIAAPIELCWSNLLFGRSVKGRYKEMPGRRSHASRLIGRRLVATERLMLAKSNIGKKPGDQAD
jgi:hypothetical protein